LAHAQRLKHLPGGTDVLRWITVRGLMHPMTNDGDLVL
jgi:hypothetical protein